MLMKNFQTIIVGLLLALSTGCNQSAVGEVESISDKSIFQILEVKNYNVQNCIKILTDTSRNYSIGDIIESKNEDLFLSASKVKGPYKSETDYWFRLDLINQLPNYVDHLEWVLYISNTFTTLDVYFLKEDGNWSVEKNGSFLETNKKKFTPVKTGNWIKVILLPGKPVTLYFKGRNDRIGLPPKFQAYIQPVDMFYDDLVVSKTWSTLFTGFLAMMLIYNLLNFIFAKDRSYMYYSGYLLMVLLYTAYSTDDLKDWTGSFIFVDKPQYFSLFKISLYTGLMCYLAFIRSFLDLERLLPLWDKYFRLLIWLGYPLIVIFIILAIRYNFNFLIDDRITLGYVSLVSFSAMFFIYPLLKTKDTKGMFITAGIAMVSIGFILTLHSRMTQIPFSVFYLKLGTILEILIFSMGLAYRHRQQVLGIQEADFALRESKLKQEQNQLEAEKLKELNDFKSNFFTNMSHEFRTPLTVILGMTDQLMNKENENSKKEKLALIKRNGENLLHLINQILDLAKLESGSLKVDYIQGDIIAYLRYITESLHSLANAQNLMLRVESTQTEFIMDYDPERLLQIIYNLISNAIKFTPSGGQIIVKVKKENTWLNIQVIDSGVGIPKEELPFLFERFFQASNQEYSKTGGTGVGLSLVAQLVKMMGGEISVESDMGRGTKFEIILPVTNIGVKEDFYDIRRKLKDIVVLSDNSTKETYAESETISKPLILISEDNPDVVEYIKSCLQDQYALEYAYNGRSGVEKAIMTVPDLIVCDVMMPEKDGFEVIEILKNDERTSHIPMILLTAKADLQSRIKGIREGADAYLTKPFNQEELLVVIHNLLETRKKLQNKYQKNVLDSKLKTSENEEITVNLEDTFLQNVKNIIEQNYSNEEFGLPQLCQKIGMSRSQLFRKLKALTDIAPSDLIRKHRLMKAKDLIKRGNSNVNEASWQVGFKDPSHFTKLYQEEFGELPSATRK